MGRKKRERRDGLAEGSLAAAPGGGAQRSALGDLKWTLTDGEHRAYRRHLGRAARWPLPIRVALAILIAGLMTWALVIVVGYGLVAVVAGCGVGLVVLLGTVIYGGKEPKVLPPCSVVLSADGYQSGGAKGTWSQFGGISEARVIEHPGGVLIARVAGKNGWADFPLAGAVRTQAEAFCRALPERFPA